MRVGRWAVGVDISDAVMAARRVLKGFAVMGWVCGVLMVVRERESRLILDQRTLW